MYGFNANLDKERVTSLFISAGFTVRLLLKLNHEYQHHSDTDKDNCWWMVFTQLGAIKIGPRKRVVHLDWQLTGLRKRLLGETPTSERTNEDTYVHSYSQDELIGDLILLRKALDEYVCSNIDKKLLEFYQLTNAIELITEMEKHIERLQESVKKYDIRNLPFPTKSRFA